METNALILSTYEDYTKIFDAFSHPMRIKIAGILAVEKKYVSELAKIMQMSRPLLYMHLKKLEEASLVNSHYEISDSGKTMKYYELKSFSIELTSHLLALLSPEIPMMTSKKD